MALTLEDLLEALRLSRRHFYKHLDGLRDDQWDFKPFPECKSIRETLQHLIVDDLAAVESIRTGKEPNYEESPYSELEIDKLRAHLVESHENLLREIKERYKDAALDADICVWGHHEKLAVGVPYYSSEDWYHAGQVAFLRTASDPSWDYYKAIYGE